MRMIAPAPRNPIPVTIWAAMRVGSTRTALDPDSMKLVKPYAETIVKSAEPTETRMCVRRPASRSRSSRSKPMAPPSAAARRSRSNAPSHESVGMLIANGSTLKLTDLPDRSRGQGQQLVELAAAEGAVLRRRLHLDELPLARHRHIEIDLGCRVLRVIEVDDHLAGDDSRRHRADGVEEHAREPVPVEG